jgi:hypothetical protein
VQLEVRESNGHAVGETLAEKPVPVEHEV